MAGDDEPDTSWQQRESTSREVVSSIFGGTLGGLLSGLISDDDDEAEQAAAERSPQVMQRRREREGELRQVELRHLLTANRRQERSGPVQLDDATIAAIRQTVDEEMPLEFALPEYLSRDLQVSMDADGNIGSRRDDIAADDDQPVDLHDPRTTDGTHRDGDPDDRAEQRAGGRAAAHLHDRGEATDDADRTASFGGSPGSAMATALAAGTTATLVADRVADDRDDEELARHVFAAASDLDLELLARRLYGRFRRDLRRELLIDRERAGTLADVC